jgi:sec-independent protein translocase protein TatC
LLFANELYSLVAEPLMRVLPPGASMIATEVASPFLTPLRLTFLASIVVAIPFLLYHIWAFVAPGLYRHERRLMLPLLVSSVTLFYGGMAFAYFVVFPVVFGFLVTTAPAGVMVMTDIKSYLDFVFGMFFAFGVAFELPVAVILLARMGVVDPHKLARQRPYVVLGIFIIAAILTPPDVISQTLLALPMIVLFEIGLFVARRMRRAHDTTAHREMSDADMTQALDDYIQEQPPARTGNPD